MRYPLIKWKINPLTPAKKMTSTNGLKIRNVATSTNESDMNENADVSINQVVSNNHPNYLKSITFSIVVKNNGPNIAQM
jgi:hypothetical protein